MNTKQKLEFFSQIALREAEKQRVTIQDEINNEFSLACENSKREIRNRCKARLQTESYKAEQNKNKEIIEALNKSKKEIMVLRNSLIDDLFKKVEKRLTSFMDSDRYGEYLMSGIKNKAESHRNVRVRLSSKDIEKYSNLIKQTFGFECEAANILGGYVLMIAEKHSIIDDSFDAKIRREREYFNKFKTSTVISEDRI